jgi:hypothetical protein
VNQQSVIGFAEYFWQNGFSLHLGGGAVIEGDIEGNGATYPIEPGWLVSVRVDKQLVRERFIIPFISLSLALSFSKATVTGGDPSSARWIATDARLGVALGYTLFNFWQIYLAPKVFGGPIYWERKGDWQRGRDRYFFQAGVGTAFLLPAGITIFAYGSPLGEQAISAGVAVTF